MSFLPFTSTHTIDSADSREYIPKESVDLVVTSPPYPMIEMWDSIFDSMNSGISSYIGSDSYKAFELMHKELDKVWESCTKACSEGGIVAINIGNATRSTEDLGFTLFHNRERIVEWFTSNGYTLLPSIIWKKPTNKPTSYLGSGCLPTSQYAVNDHEYILLFRKGDRRSFEPKSERRYSSAYFYDERNTWFSGEWTVKGESQELSEVNRDVTAAYPLEIPYRLIQMYSLYNDTVYDPFGGTGTTQLAALISGRNSIGIDIDENFKQIVKSRLINNGREVSAEKSSNRLSTQKQKGDLNYQSNVYDISIKTKKEKNLTLQEVVDISEYDSRIEATHEIYKD